VGGAEAPDEDRAWGGLGGFIDSVGREGSEVNEGGRQGGMEA